MSTWADVEARGYKTSESAPGVRCVTGDGLLIYVKENDQATIDSLANPAPLPAPTPAVVAGPTPLEAIAALDPKTATVADVIDAVKTSL